jgi:hypothetical protein
MKSLIITLVALSLGLIFFFYRRRLKLAILVAGSLYIVLTVIRFIVLREEVDRFMELGLALAGLGAVWLGLNLAIRFVERRRQRSASRSPSSDRVPR